MLKWSEGYSCLFTLQYLFEFAPASRKYRIQILAKPDLPPPWKIAAYGLPKIPQAARCEQAQHRQQSGIGLQRLGE